MIHWQEENNTLVTTIECKHFMEAVEYINTIAALAEEQQHHPDLRIHGYKMLDIRLTTHDAGGITEKDHALARAIEQHISQ